jgi:hypothetical protein
MGSPPRTKREEEQRLNLRTLVIASAASATAALVTSRLWIAGTWIAAAMTPVIVALVSEILNRPTERLARTFTTERDALPVAGGAAPPARPEADPLPTRVPEEPYAGAGRAEPPVNVYRAGSGRAPRRAGAPRRRRKIAYGMVFGTAALAFVIAVVALTVPELIAGGSVGKNDGGTTFFRGDDKKKDQGGGTQTEQQTTPQEEEQPEETAPEEQTTPTTPTTPEETTTTPAPQAAPETTTPETTTTP